jgi:hypothetical protein
MFLMNMINVKLVTTLKVGIWLLQLLLAHNVLVTALVLLQLNVLLVPILTINLLQEPQILAFFVQSKIV